MGLAVLALGFVVGMMTVLCKPPCAMWLKQLAYVLQLACLVPVYSNGWVFHLARLPGL